MSADSGSSAEKDGLTEWGVRFPSGSIQTFGSEQEARRYAIATSALRPDLPTLVVRHTVTPWEVATDA